MKLFIVLAAVSLAHAAKLDRVYLPPNARGSAGTGSFLRTPQLPARSGIAQTTYSGLAARRERPQAALDRSATILRLDNVNNVDNYSYTYKTSNGINGQESGVATKGTQAQGGYSYTGDDGKVYSVWYTAGVNGFVPQGDHLPTPPPIPKEILKALEQNARDEAAGIFDDGSYAGAKYSRNGQRQHSSTNAQRYNYNRPTTVNKAYLPPRA